MAQRLGRLQKEIQRMKENPSPGISCWPSDDNLTKFSAVLVGDEDTVYAGGLFHLSIEVSDRYPFQPPKVQFVTKIYHPNIDSSGRICLDILKMPPVGGWRPAHNLATILTSVKLLMAAPNPDDPLMTDIADEFRLNRELFEMKAREWTAKFAKEVVGHPSWAHAAGES